MAAKKIERVTKNDTSRTLMHASVANELIDRLNEHEAFIQALKAMTVSPQTAGSFKFADANVTLILNTVKCQ